jgi:squalene cyclase
MLEDHSLSSYCCENLRFFIFTEVFTHFILKNVECLYPRDGAISRFSSSCTLN